MTYEDAKFDVSPTISGGAVVIATDTGRPVSGEYLNRAGAAGAASHLNMIVKSGDRKALCKALGAIDGPMPKEFIRVGGR
jgi:hypothetical protein